jgi:hypothetical protein
MPAGPSSIRQPNLDESPEARNGLWTQPCKDRLRSGRIIEHRPGSPLESAAPNEDRDGSAFAYELLPPGAVSSRVDPILFTQVVDRDATTARKSQEHDLLRLLAIRVLDELASDPRVGDLLEVEPSPAPDQEERRGDHQSDSQDLHACDG